MSDTKYCKDCKNMNCPESRVNCKYPDAIACDLYRDTPPTIFQLITVSPEVLAPEFVEMMYDRVAGDYRYYSMLTGEFYNSGEKAIDATVAWLKEVREDD